MYKANMHGYKALIHVIKYVIDRKKYFYQMKIEENLNIPWELHGYSDKN